MPKTGTDYGLDAPGVVRNMFLVATALLAVAAVGQWRGWHRIESITGAMAAGYLFGAVLMVLSSRVGKLKARDRLLDGLHLTGDEQVLDVGCGHGLLLIGAALRVPRGRAVGVDLWSQTDQQGNSAAAARINASAEGVAERVAVQDGDMRNLPFPDASFDVVVSSLAIHNLSSRDDRRRAIGEIVRVLRPGGRVAMLDIAHVGQYAADLRAAGLADARAGGWTPWIFPPARLVSGRKSNSD